MHQLAKAAAECAERRTSEPHEALGSDCLEMNGCQTSPSRKKRLMRAQGSADRRKGAGRRRDVIMSEDWARFDDWPAWKRRTNDCAVRLLTSQRCWMFRDYEPSGERVKSCPRREVSSVCRRYLPIII
ncbi:hypothetical protein MHYP_G00336170 [Metynnis hypsauchen]